MRQHRTPDFLHVGWDGKHNVRAWIVGQNEAVILGEGWYDRAPDWFGLPFRESFPRAILRIPSQAVAGPVTLLLSSALAFHNGAQWVEISVGEACTRHVLPAPIPGQEWRAVTVPPPPRISSSGCLEITLVAQPWRHGELEEIQDFREVGILFAGVLV